MRLSSPSEETRLLDLQRKTCRLRCRTVSRLRRESLSRRNGGDLLKYVMVGLGGCLGSILRFWLGSYIGSRMGTRFPYGTFVINVSGSFLIGLVFALLSAKTSWSPNWRYLIPIGFIGGYTTFSSFEFESLRSIQDGQIGLGLLYVGLSVVLGFVAVWGGMVTGTAIS
jgi:fluoride exporter